MNNAVPPGYKQTEVGVIPEEWEVNQVTDFCGFIVPGRNKPKCFDGDIPWITTPDLEDGGYVSESKSGLFVTRNEAKNVGSKVVPTDSIIMTCVGELGIVAIAKRDVVLNQQLHAFIPSSEVVALFLMYAIKTRQSYLESIATKTALPYLNKENCNSIQVPLPPLPEQRAIAAALSDVDALIASLDKLITKKRDMKQAAMQELLTGKLRLPGFDIVGAYGNTPNSRGACTTVKPGECHSPLPDVPHGWEVKKLGEIADIRSGGTPSTSVPQFWEGDIPWCTPTDITALAGRKYLFDTSRKITSSGLQSSSAEMLPTHSIVMTSRATIGECAINTVPVSTNQGFKNFIPFDATDIEFLYYLLTTQKSGFIGLCSGSTFLEIGKAQLLSYQVCLPSKKTEQTAIAAILSDMDTEIAALEQKRDKTRLLKQGMMQELLTGRIRLV